MLKISKGRDVRGKFDEFPTDETPCGKFWYYTCLDSDIRFFLTRLPIIRAHMPGSPYINIEHKSHPVSRLQIYISPETIRYADQVSTFGNLQNLQFLFLKNLKVGPKEAAMCLTSANAAFNFVKQYNRGVSRSQKRLRFWLQQIRVAWSRGH